MTASDNDQAPSSAAEHARGRGTQELDLAAVLNRYSAENASNTPDFVLASYLLRCLHAFDDALLQRAAWYGRMDQPGHGPVPFTDSTQLVALAAQVEGLQALLHDVGTFGQAFIWTDPKTGQQHRLHPADVQILVSAADAAKFHRLAKPDTMANPDA